MNENIYDTQEVSVSSTQGLTTDSAESEQDKESCMNPKLIPEEGRVCERAVVPREKPRRKSKRKKLYWKGYRNTLIKLLLTTGAITYSGLQMLPGNRIMYIRKLKEMEGEKILEIFRNNGKQLARLNHFDSLYKNYIDSLPNGYYGHYNRYGRSNHRRVAVVDKNGVTSERVIRECEVTQMMYGAGVSVFPDEKTEMRGNALIDSEEISYYSSHELKECDTFHLHLNSTDKKDNYTMTSRIIGCLISPGGKYAVYHTGHERLFWKKASEGQIAYYISGVINKKCENPNMSGSAKDCIMVGKDMGVFQKIFEGRKPGCVSVESGYERMYAIPYDKNGQKMLERMTKDGWRRKLLDRYLIGYDTDTSMNNIICDGIQESRIALVFCDGDIVRLKKYITAIQWVKCTQTNITYEIYCHDFQQNFVSEVSEALADIILVEL